MSAIMLCLLETAYGFVVMQVVAGSLLAGILISANLLVLRQSLPKLNRLSSLVFLSHCILYTALNLNVIIQVQGQSIVFPNKSGCGCDIVFLGVHSDFRENKLITMLSLPD